MSFEDSKVARDAVEKYGPLPTTAVERLAHTVKVFEEIDGDRVAVMATSNIYGKDVTTGLTFDDLRELHEIIVVAEARDDDPQLPIP